jgi:hypothetical protein
MFSVSKQFKTSGGWCWYKCDSGGVTIEQYFSPLSNPNQELWLLLIDIDIMDFGYHIYEY